MDTHTVQYPQGNVCLRNLEIEFPVINYGQGIYLYDQAGKRYLDASSGAFVVSVGHGIPEIVEAISAQLKKVSYVNGMQFTSTPTEALASRICQHTEKFGLSRCSFLSSGSEAIEAAIKFTRQLWHVRKKNHRSKIITRLPSYHGNTLFALSVSGRPHYKTPYTPLLHPVVTISAPNEYRAPVKDYAADGADYYARELELVLAREGAESIMAFLVEPISGSSVGGNVPPPGYFEKVQKILRRYEIPIIADEVFVGAGRTGSFLASEQVGLEPDVVVMGKGLNGGYAPLSAIIFREGHLNELKKGMGGFRHAQTFLQAPCSTIAGVAVLEYMDRNQVIEKVEMLGNQLHQQLHERLDKHPNVGHIAGKGLMAGIEFVENKETKAPFERSRCVAERLQAHALRKGMTLWPNVGHVDNIRGDLAMIGPPLTILPAEINELVELFGECVESFFSDEMQDET